MSIYEPFPGNPAIARDDADLITDDPLGETDDMGSGPEEGDVITGRKADLPATGGDAVIPGTTEGMGTGSEDGTPSEEFDDAARGVLAPPPEGTGPSLDVRGLTL